MPKLRSATSTQGRNMAGARALWVFFLHNFEGTGALPLPCTLLGSHLFALPGFGLWSCFSIFSATTPALLCPGSTDTGEQEWWR